MDANDNEGAKFAQGAQHVLVTAVEEVKAANGEYLWSRWGDTVSQGLRSDPSCCPSAGRASHLPALVIVHGGLAPAHFGLEQRALVRQVVGLVRVQRLTWDGGCRAI